MNESGMRFIDPPKSDDRVVAAEIDGQMTTEDMNILIERLQSIVDRGEKALLYIDMQNYKGFELGVMSEKLKHMGMLWKALDKYAIVGASRWMEIWIDIVDPVTPQQIKHFSPDKADEAWAWLLASETMGSANHDVDY
jgi:hypothetical protein